jgi:hypothetical protein
MGGMKYGYARTSTDDQTTALQLCRFEAGQVCPHLRGQGINWRSR